MRRVHESVTNEQALKYWHISTRNIVSNYLSLLFAPNTKGTHIYQTYQDDFIALSILTKFVLYMVWQAALVSKPYIRPILAFSAMGRSGWVITFRWTWICGKYSQNIYNKSTHSYQSEDQNHFAFKVSSCCPQRVSNEPYVKISSKVEMSSQQENSKIVLNLTPTRQSFVTLSNFFSTAMVNQLRFPTSLKTLQLSCFFTAANATL